jgi:prepilin-type N-terminal cleavage/methylation domain-containing protein
MRKIKSNKKGFSLVELMVVLVVMSILTSELLPRFFELQKTSEARSEYSKLIALKVKLNGLYSSDFNYEGVNDTWIQQLPSSFSKDNGKVYSIWKKEVVVKEIGHSFFVEYLDIPAGIACIEFAKLGKASGWSSLEIDNNLITAETKTSDITNICKSESATSVISNFKFYN